MVSNYSKFACTMQIQRDLFLVQVLSRPIEGGYQRSKRGRVLHHKLLRLAREELAKRVVFPSNPICQNVPKRDT